MSKKKSALDSRPEVDLIMNMVIVMREPRIIIELKDRSGALPPQFIPEFGGTWTGEGYGTVDCTSDLDIPTLQAVIRFLTNKLVARQRALNAEAKP